MGKREEANGGGVKFGFQWSVVFGFLLVVFFGGCSSYVSLLVLVSVAVISPFDGIAVLFMAGGLIMGCLGFFLVINGFLKRRKELLELNKRNPDKNRIYWSFGAFTVLAMVPTTVFALKFLWKIYGRKLTNGWSVDEIAFEVVAVAGPIILAWVLYFWGLRKLIQSGIAE